MSSIIDGCVITDLELLCLASISGMKKIYGYNIKTEELKKDIYYAVYTLAKKGHVYVEKNEDSIKISNEITYILDVIKNFDEILDIKVYATGERVIVYRKKKDNSVIIRQNSTSSNELIISVIPTKYISDYLKDEGYITCVGKSDLFLREDIYTNEKFRKDIKEDRILAIKRIGKEYNIEEKIEVYESILYDLMNNKSILLTHNNFFSVIDRGFK